MVFRYPALPTQLASTQLGEPLSRQIADAAVGGLSQAGARRRRSGYLLKGAGLQKLPDAK